jgi:hypothetical protein
MQFDINSSFFTPLSHDPFLLNKTLRNWTLISPNGFDKKCIIDPCGMLTLGKDSFSIGIGVYNEAKSISFPEKIGNSKVLFEPLENNFKISYQGYGEQVLESYIKKNTYFIHSTINFDNFLILVRPFNPEGVSPIFSIKISKDAIYINKQKIIETSGIKKSYLSNYLEGDILNLIGREELKEKESVECDYGFCTGAFEIEGNSFSIFPAKYKKILTPKKYTINFDDSFRFKISEEELIRIYRTQIVHLNSFCSQNGIVSGGFTDNELKIDDYVYLIPALDKIGKTSLAEKYLRNIASKKLSNKDLGKYVWLLLNHYLISKNKKFLLDNENNIYLILDKISIIRGKNPNFLLPPSKGKYETSPIKKYIEDDFWSLSAYKLAYKIFEDDKLKRDFLSYLAVIKEEIQTYSDEKNYDFTKLIHPEPLCENSEELTIGKINSLKKILAAQGAFYNPLIEGYDILMTLDFLNTLLILNDNDSIDLFLKIFKFSNSTGAFPQAVNPLTMNGSYGDGHYSPVTAAIISFISDIFAYDKMENELHLLKVSKKEWYENTIEVEKIPTRFGKISYKIIKNDNFMEFSVNETNIENIFVHFPFDVIIDGKEKPTKTIKIPKGVRKLSFSRYEN